MDLATVLARVDARHYTGLDPFYSDVHQIVSATMQECGDDPSGIRAVMRSSPSVGPTVTGPPGPLL